MDECNDEQAANYYILALIEDALDPAGLKRLAEHLISCTTCRILVLWTLSDRYAVLMKTTALQCPGCESAYVHQHEVHVYERLQDAVTGTHVCVRGLDKPQPQVVVGSSMVGNPSTRRQGITIHFWCEHCKCRFLLTVAQHKGFTLMETELEEPAHDIHGGSRGKDTGK